MHRLSDLGAVVTHVTHGTSQEGFEAEWRMIRLLTVEGDLINRCELFDEADIDAALARFDELSPPAPRLENAASRVDERYSGAIRGPRLGRHGRDTGRRLFRVTIVVGSSARASDDGRDAEIADMRAIADIGVTNARRTAVIATRGERLVLSRVRFSGREHGPDAVVTDVLGIVETNADNRIAATVVFDPDDIDAAFEELDARYLAGEAAAHSHTWSVIARAYAAFNRHELPATTPDWVNIDHRRGIAFAPGDLTAFIRAAWDVTPDDQHLHRGRASAEQPRSGRHPCGERDLTRGLRRPSGG